jgi:hypothetical protein
VRPAATEFLECSFDATQEAPREARVIVDRWTGRLDDDVLDTVRLLVSELIGLSVGSRDIGQDGRVALRLELEEWRLRVEIARDRGRFLFPTAGDETPDLTLTLVDELADRWGLTRVASGTACWFEIDC